jgi:hypothetical protein
MKISRWPLVAAVGCFLTGVASLPALAGPLEPGTCPVMAAAIKGSDVDAMTAELASKPKYLNTACIGTGMSAQSPLTLVVTRFDNDIARQVSKKDATIADHNRRMEQMLLALVKAGANVNVQGGADQPTPLMLSVMSESPSAVRALLKAGADPNARTVDGQTALKIAKENAASSAPIIELLKKAGATE